MPILKSPFPQFGGKSRAASEIWKRFGDVPNYVDPFCASLAIPLSRPHEPGIETVNDADKFICNFWRAARDNPDEVARWADQPVNECDLEAQHFWLISKGVERLADLLTDPDASDPKIAGWWCHGACSWIGSGWCSGDGPWRIENGKWALRNAGHGVNRQLPHLGDAGQGVNRKFPLNSESVHGIGIRAYLHQIADRLRRVRVACGDWTRIVTPSCTHRHGMTGLLLDPPYGEGEIDYQAGGNRDRSIADAAREFAIQEGRNPLMRIALCGYEGQHEMPDDWSVFEWKAIGGYSSTAEEETQGQLNRHRERIWFSPACLPVEQPMLFATT